MNKQGLIAIVMLFLTACQNSGQVRPTEPSTEQVRPDKKAAELNMQLGISYMQRGDYETALQKLQKAIRQDHNLASAQMTIAVLYNRLAELEQAEYHYKRAIKIAPNYSEAQNNYGTFLCQQGRHEESVERFLKAVENPLYKNPDQAYENAGLCAREIPDLDRAERYLRKALQMNPRLGKSLLGMAEISYQQADYMTGRAYIQRFREAARWTPEALLTAIKIENQLDDQDAVASYSVLLRGRFPDSEQAKQVKRGQY